MGLDPEPRGDVTGHTLYDALVIGGGPAGLQAALTLGRTHRTAVLVHSGQCRDGMVEHAHNFATHDGRAPDEIGKLAREEVACYDTVELREATVRTVRDTGDGMVTETDAGSIEARALVLAAGSGTTCPTFPGCGRPGAARLRHARSATAVSSPIDRSPCSATARTYR
jgi:thioredoxin reductase